MNILTILNAPWAIMPKTLEQIHDIYNRKMQGEVLDIEKIEADIGRPLNNNQKGYDIIEGNAIISLHGVIAKRMNLFSQISGGVSTELVKKTITEAIEDSSVNKIILDIDSGGGTVDGTQDLVDFIYNSRGKKEIITFTDGLMASAAYWIGSASDKVYISNNTTIVGSIGVITKHYDFSEAQKANGTKVTSIYAGQYKDVGSEHKPLNKDDKENIQERIDYFYSVFVDSVARNRGVSVDKVLNDMADAKLFIGEQAIEAGLVDGVLTFEKLIDGETASKTNIFNAENKTIKTQREDENKMGDEKNKDVVTEAPTVESLKANNADIANALIAEGKTAGVTAGAEAERQRIKDVEAQLMPGHEALIDKLKYDGTTTAGEASMQVLSAEKEKVKGKASAIEADAKELDKISHADTSAVEGTGSTGQDLDANDDTGIKEAAKANWDKDGAIRSEFNGNFDAYHSFFKQDLKGNVQVRKNEK